MDELRDELRNEVDLRAWRVEQLPPGFAERVLTRVYSADDALEAELEAMADEVESGEEYGGPTTLRPGRHGRRQPRSTRWWVAAAAVGVGAAALLWLRPGPSNSEAGSTVASPGVQSSTAVEVSKSEPVALADDAPEPAGLDRDSIRRAVAEQFVPQASLCYSELRARMPGVEGRVTLRFGVVRREDRGVVDRCEVAEDPEIVDDTFHACLVDAMMAVEFEAPDDVERVEIVYPILFRLAGFEGTEVQEIVLEE